MTTEQTREYSLGRIRAYAIEHGIAGDDIALIFEAGMAAAVRLRPDLADIFGPSPEKEADHAA